jgi:hypothetical protein
MLSKDNITISLFIVSYLLYWLKMPILLAILYPFTISWYNFILFGYIMRLNNMLYIALSMIVIGWLSTIMANGIVLEGYFWIAYAILGLSSTIFYIKNKGKT